MSQVLAVEELKKLSNDIRLAIAEIERSDGDRVRIVNVCGWLQKSTQGINQIAALLWATTPATEVKK